MSILFLGRLLPEGKGGPRAVLRSLTQDGPRRHGVRTVCATRPGAKGLRAGPQIKYQLGRVGT